MKENILAIICLILLPFIAFIWSYLNYSIVKIIEWLISKWDNYQINRINQKIKKHMQKQKE